MARINDKAARDVDASEPLLPIEKAFVGWSIIVGAALVIMLAAANHGLPVS